MNHMTRRTLLWLILGMLALLGGGCRPAPPGTVNIDPEMPFFAAPAADAAVLGVARAATTLPSLEARRVYVRENPASGRVWIPLTLATWFHRVQVPDGPQAWVSEDLLYDTARQVPVPRVLPDADWRWPAVLAFALCLLLAYAVWRSGPLADFGPGGGALSRRRLAAALGLVLACRVFGLALILYLAGHYIVTPTDELSYFRTALDMYFGRDTGTCIHPIGLSYLYLPFIFFVKAQSYFDIVGALQVAEGFVLGPLLLLLVFLALRHILDSDRAALLATLILALLPFLYFPVEHHGEAHRLFRAIPDLPRLSSTSYQLYYVYSGTCYNGMSDMPSAVLGLALLTGLLYLRPRWPLIAGAALLLGFLCMVRPANAFLAPVVAWLCWHRFRAEAKWSPWRLLAWGLGAGLLTLAAMAPQLLVNAADFGGPFTFCYSLHAARAGEGFTLHDFFYNYSYLVNVNYALAVAAAVGLSALVTCRRRHSLLALWALPIFLFYCGYPVVTTNSVRFILTTYGALLGAFLAARVWRSLPRADLWWAGGVLLLNVALVAPPERLSPPSPWSWHLWDSGPLWVRAAAWTVPLLSLLVLVWRFRGRPRALVFLGSFVLLFQLGSPGLVITLLVGHFLLAMGRLAGDVGRAFRAPAGMAPKTGSAPDC